MMDLAQLPQTPTDNLYKFMAIFGLTLLIVGLVVPPYLSYTERVNQVEMMAKIRAADAQMLTSGGFELLDKAKDTLNAEPNMPEEKKAHMSAMVDMLEVNAKAMDELRKSLARGSFMNWMLVVSAVVSSAGIILIFFGFHLWYYKLQIHQDVLIANQAKISEREMLNHDSKNQEDTDKQEDAEKQEEGVKNE